MKFLIDADVPVSVRKALRDLGHDVTDVRDLPGAPWEDPPIDRLAQREQRILITRDVGFANRVRFPLHPGYGRLVIRMHRVSPASIVEMVRAVVQQLSEADLLGALVIVQPGRWRIWRAPTA